MISDVKPGQEIMIHHRNHTGQYARRCVLIRMSRFQGIKYAKVKRVGSRITTIERTQIVSVVRKRKD